MNAANDWFFELFEEEKINSPELELTDELPSMPLVTGFGFIPLPGEAKHRAESLHRARVLMGIALGAVVVGKVVAKTLDKDKDNR